MSDVFISYSRRDAVFVQHLYKAFVGANQVTWVDWDDIPRGEQWWMEIQRGIEEADTFVCIVSEHWMLSPICHEELTYARTYTKRVIPVIRQRIDGNIETFIKGKWYDQPWREKADANWKYIKSCHWSFFDDDERFDREFSELLKALTTDQSHLKAHTRYLGRALEWERVDKNPSFLLSGDELIFAEKWQHLADKEHKQPALTDSHRAYIAASRQREDAQQVQDTRRERITRQFRHATLILALVGTLAGAIAALAGIAASRAENDRANAQLQAITATIAQGAAEVAAATALRDASSASTAVAIANNTLTPIPVTLTAAATVVRGSLEEQLVSFSFSQAMLSLTSDTWAARHKLQEVTTLLPNYPIGHIGLGLVYTQLQEYERAGEEFSLAIDLGLNDALVYMSRGISYVARQDYENAIEDYTTAIALDPNNPQVYHLRGEAHGLAGNYSSSVRDFDQAIVLDPKYALSH
jgi:tetratricopeptide (TPR) repeat protein